MDQKLASLQETVWGFYNDHGRHDLPWRNSITPYRILVSEMMLQQTQVSRVLNKYPEFLLQFPDFGTLASSSTADLLQSWQGLGYNRRALNLRRSAQVVMADYNGIVDRPGSTGSTVRYWSSNSWSSTGLCFQPARCLHRDQYSPGLHPPFLCRRYSR